MALILAGCEMALHAQMGGKMGQEGPPPGEGRPPMPSADAQLKRLSKQLSLTSGQQQKIKPILENQVQQMQSLRQDTSLSREDRMSKFQQIHQDAVTQIKAVLTSDQQAKFDKMQTMRMYRHGSSDQNQDDGPPPDGPPPGEGPPPGKGFGPPQ
jgi:Spy/CpxP family protein refolding chaperone